MSSLLVLILRLLFYVKLCKLVKVHKSYKTRWLYRRPLCTRVDLQALPVFVPSYENFIFTNTHNLRSQIGLFIHIFSQNTERTFPSPLWVSHFQPITSFWDFMTLILSCEKVHILKLLSFVVQLYTLSRSFICLSVSLSHLIILPRTCS
jgi:hypothetical protein